MRRRLRVTGVRVAVNNPEGGERCSIARRFFRVNLTEREPFSPSDPQDQVERGPGELRQIFSKATRCARLRGTSIHILLPPKAQAISRLDGPRVGISFKNANLNLTITSRELQAKQSMTADSQPLRKDTNSQLNRQKNRLKNVATGRRLRQTIPRIYRASAKLHTAHPLD